MAEGTTALEDEIALGREERLILITLQCRMMEADIAATRRASGVEAKRDGKNAIARGLVSEVFALPTDGGEIGSGVEAEMRAMLGEHAPEHRHLMVGATAPVACAHVADRSRALIILIDLVLFRPWNWVGKAHDQALREAVSLLPGVGEGDLAKINRYRASAVRAAALHNRDLHRVLVSVAARSLLIPKALPSSVGLPLDDAVPSAFESLASAYRLELVTRIVLLDTQHDLAKAKLAVVALHKRVAELSTKVRLLADLVADYRAQLEELKREKEEQRVGREEADAEIARLQQVIDQMIAEREATLRSERGVMTIAASLERIAS